MRTILVADDEAGIRGLLRGILESPDCHVLEAGTGAETLQLAREIPDLIVLDRRMPDGDGFEVIRRLRAQDDTARIPVILMSGVEQDDCYEWATAMGVAACMYKPFRPVQLLQKVQELLTRPPLRKPPGRAHAAAS
jgi:two-component system phosphate regulon response regulator PhoB